MSKDKLEKSKYKNLKGQKVKQTGAGSSLRQVQKLIKKEKGNE